MPKACPFESGDYLMAYGRIEKPRPGTCRAPKPLMFPTPDDCALCIDLGPGAASIACCNQRTSQFGLYERGTRKSASAAGGHRHHHVSVTSRGVCAVTEWRKPRPVLTKQHLPALRTLFMPCSPYFAALNKGLFTKQPP